MNVILNRIRTASKIDVFNGSDPYEVKDEGLLQMLNDGANTIEILDDYDISETVDELTDKFSTCYHININRFKEREYDTIFTGYVNCEVVAAIENGEYEIID